MELPAFYFIDLPQGAELNATMLEESARALRRNRELYLLPRSIASLIRLISDVAANWLDPENSFRQWALRDGPSATGFSSATLARGLDDFFRQITADNLRALLTQEVGGLEFLEGFNVAPSDKKRLRPQLANGPEFIFHIAGGALPNSILLSLITGLLLKSAQFVKCASGAGFLPRLFAHSLYQADNRLGSCIELAEWHGGNTQLESPLIHSADCVTATGSDEAVAQIRHHVPVDKRFIGYGHRVSFAFIAHETLAGFNPGKIVARAARDITAWNQLGCLSPHILYVEESKTIGAEKFSEMLAEELARLELIEPRGSLPEAQAANIASRRAFYEIRAAHSPETRHWFSPESTAWTVIYEADPLFQLSALNRFIYVKPVSSLTHALQSADRVRGKVSTVGLAAPEDRAPALALELARWGVTRVCPLGEMQNPSLLWHHDGRPPLGEFVTWTDWEQPEN